VLERILLLRFRGLLAFSGFHFELKKKLTVQQVADDWTNYNSITGST
jgi:hypothetical protein